MEYINEKLMASRIVEKINGVIKQTQDFLSLSHQIVDFKTGEGLQLARYSNSRILPFWLNKARAMYDGLCRTFNQMSHNLTELYNDGTYLIKQTKAYNICCPRTNLDLGSKFSSSIHDAFMARDYCCDLLDYSTAYRSAPRVISIQRLNDENY